jgi:hypothetical protein
MSLRVLLNLFEAPVLCFRPSSTGAKVRARHLGPLDGAEVKGLRTMGLIVFYCQVRDIGRPG